MGGERGDAGFSATSKSGSTSLFNIGWLVAVLEVGANGKGDKPVMTWRTVVVLGAAAITREDKRAKDTPDTSREIVVFLCTILSPRYLISSLSCADPPGSGFNNTNFSLLLCPENPENTANGSGKILESDSAQLRRFERVTIVVSGPYTNVGSNHPPSRVPGHLAPGVDEAFRLLHARHVTTAIVSISWDFIAQWFAKRFGAAHWAAVGFNPDGTVTPF